ncbi:hypothetical protein GWK08_01040 [Leptobacterium flavescens]|uniref:Uncharacterized protein n=1 Tax=Leptobacterium flavescens TaxID=472055 RepID=A0A6P0ULT3_9FLAO|nr:hypothetical protein [Leptobacterium flavescens]NER12013.1 hypothetical protein [Leptobacterium flavescens]
MDKKKKYTEQEGFKVPEDYFTSFEDKLFAGLEDASTDAKDGFKVPKAYFESLEDRILDSIDKENNEEEVKVIKLSSYKKYFYASIAVAAGLFLFFGTDLFTIEATVPQTTVAEVENEDIDSFIDEGLLTLSTYDISMLFEDVNLEDITVAPEEIEDNALIEYLSDKLEDYDELIIDN